MESLRVVLDTNVLFAGLYSDTGASHAVLNLVSRGRLVSCVSAPLVLEYEKVLLDRVSELGQSAKGIRAIIDYLCAISVRQAVHFLWRPALPDPGDDMILELAVAAGAPLVVTHNLSHFVGCGAFGIRALSPSELLHELRRTP